MKTPRLEIIAFAFSALAVFATTEAFGQTSPSVPATISYQGRIEDAAFPEGADGEHEFSFLIFDAATGGKLLWSETQPGVTVEDGRYRVELWAVEPIPFGAVLGDAAWLEVRVFGEALGARRRLVSAPFALRAEGEIPEGAVVLGRTSGDANGNEQVTTLRG